MKLSKYLKLRISDDLTSDSRYNLERLDLLGSTSALSTNNETIFQSQNGILILPNSAVSGGSGSGGTVSIGEESNPIDEIELNADLITILGSLDLVGPLNLEEIRLFPDSNVSTTYVRILPNPASTGITTLTLPIDDGAASQVLATDGSGNLSWVNAPSNSLPQNNIQVGNPSNISTPTDTSTLGDIQASSSAGLTLKPNIIDNADISNSANIARSKLASGSAGALVANDGTGALTEITPTNNDILVGNGTAWAKQSKTTLLTGTELQINKGAANGYAPLDASSKIPTANLPQIALSEVFVVSDIPARDALTVEEGDIAKITSTSQTFVYDGSSWIEITTTSAVDSVNGQTGTVNLELNDIADVDAATPSVNDVLTYDGNDWVPQSTQAVPAEQLKSNAYFTYVGDGVETTYFLGQNPVVIEAYVNSILIDPNDYTVSGTDIIFDTAPGNGDPIEIEFTTTYITPLLNLNVGYPDNLDDENTDYAFVLRNESQQRLETLSVSSIGRLENPKTGAIAKHTFLATLANIDELTPVVGDLLYFDGAANNYKYSDATDEAKHVRYVITKIDTDSNLAILQTSGYAQESAFSALNDGETYYLDPANPGKVTNIKPSTPGDWVLPAYHRVALSNGITIMSSDSGYQIPAAAGGTELTFSSRLTTQTTIAFAGSFTKVPSAVFTTVDHNVGTVYSSGSNEWTLPAGKYEASFHFGYKPTGAADQAVFRWENSTDGHTILEWATFRGGQVPLNVTEMAMASNTFEITGTKTFVFRYQNGSQWDFVGNSTNIRAYTFIIKKIG